MTGADNQFDAAVRPLADLGVGVTLVADQPTPLLVLSWEGRWSDPRLDHGLLLFGVRLTKAFGGRDCWPDFRCVSLGRLAVILRTGCDVEPPDAVIFVAGSPGKTLEYGDADSKVMLLLDPEKLRSSHREVPADLDPAELAELARDYPTRLELEDGVHLWLSRLPRGDRRIYSPYEVEYGRWISGDPWQALLGVVVLVRQPGVVE